MNEYIRTICRLKPNVCSGDSGLSMDTRSSTIGANSPTLSYPIQYEVADFTNNSARKSILRVHPVQECPADIPNDYNPCQDFVFDQVLQADSSQEVVFDTVAKPLIPSFLSGINCCIFCYGQTSAGKTYTASGGATFQSRGLIQRCIESLFASLEIESLGYQVLVSYVEIYNECGYDLLTPTDPNTPIETWPRVILQEDETGCLHLRNLSLHSVSSAQEALDVFLYGNLNRIISSTPMNDASSRSHCIFSLHLEMPSGEDTGLIRTSKLNIVDLAGSERIMKSKLREQDVREAKYINKSLHFLEQVISSLAKKTHHVPYRNSVLTSLLRDSLGGLCKTVMVANISSDGENYRESVATCRFAQRCGMVMIRPDAELFARTRERAGAPQDATPAIDTFPLRAGITSQSEVTLRDLLERCGTDLTSAPKEMRKSLVDKIRRLGMDCPVTCVGELCALVQVLVAKLAQADDEKKSLVERIKKAPAKIAINLPADVQWRRSHVIDEDI